jgi:hypothetical protein
MLKSHRARQSVVIEIAADLDGTCIQHEDYGEIHDIFLENIYIGGKEYSAHSLTEKYGQHFLNALRRILIETADSSDWTIE